MIEQNLIFNYLANGNPLCIELLFFHLEKVSTYWDKFQEKAAETAYQGRGKRLVWKSNLIFATCSTCFLLYAEHLSCS